MAERRGRRVIREAAAALALALAPAWAAAAGACQESPAPGPPGFDFEARFAVPANVPWTDTGLDVQTVQQPLQGRNLGAFVVRIAQLISITKDEKTGEETRNEIVRFVYVGAEATIQMPIAGRLYLGLNEDVVGDNAGELGVEVWRRVD